MHVSFPILFAFVLLVGCGGRHQPSMPVEQAPEACCTKGDMQLQHFSGCRVGGRRCGEREVYWMRGAVTCGPVDTANCAGGRCCHYRPRVDTAAETAAVEPVEPPMAAEPPAAEPTTDE